MIHLGCGSNLLIEGFHCLQVLLTVETAKDQQPAIDILRHKAQDSCIDPAWSGGASSGRIRLARWRHSRTKKTQRMKPKSIILQNYSIIDTCFQRGSSVYLPPRSGWKKPPITTHLGQHMEPWPTQQQANFENHEVWGVPSKGRVQ